MAHFRLKEIAKPQRWSAHSIKEKTGLSYNTVWTIWTNRSSGCEPPYRLH